MIHNFTDPRNTALHSGAALRWLSIGEIEPGPRGRRLGRWLWWNWGLGFRFCGLEVNP